MRRSDDSLGRNVSNVSSRQPFLNARLQGFGATIFAEMSALALRTKSVNLGQGFPDTDGLRYWIGKYTSGVNDDRAVAQSFLVSDEFAERYGSNVTNAKYVETLYVNVLGRDYDQNGYNYWLGNLNNGTETRYELLLGFAESAENKTLFTEMTGLS